MLAKEFRSYRISGEACHAPTIFQADRPGSRSRIKIAGVRDLRPIANDTESRRARSQSLGLKFLTLCGDSPAFHSRSHAQPRFIELLEDAPAVRRTGAGEASRY